ncbi:AAA family ATPase [Janthinobacterium lividum]|uniref:AAA family ATPase n=1 Tax=Janthinobacterium lividum TaxID=29581 RepID=UPI001B818FD4|nr:AAA family ATPase [Janthinobacterium lividum]MBR7634513.1 AAA family ATPase [Janthinobacterium lividum]
MSKSFSEFKRFLQTELKDLSEFEKKLARLLLEDFRAVELLGTAGGRRGKKIAELILAKGDSISAELNFEGDTSAENASRIVRLSKITVGNFRGFSSEHTFDFKNPYTFIYGPNGTGKSSLCEALEYSLLGSIIEADSKRIEVGAYVRNSITKLSNLPVLLGISADGTKNVVVRPDPKSYEFCFIEKNRIDGFARVAANTAAAQQSRLAALFGLEDFNNFCTQFSDRFENYIDTVGKKKGELSEKEKQIAGHRAILLKVPEDEKEIKVRLAAFMQNYPSMASLEAVRLHISGSDTLQGMIQKNHAEIARLNNLVSVQDPGIDAVSAEVASLSAMIQERRSARQILHQYKEQLSLAELYSALLKNKEKSENNCPACESVLYVEGNLQVPIDPYANAMEKLTQFELALKKEARIKEITDQLQERWPRLEANLSKVNQAAILVKFEKSAEITTIYAASEQVTDTKKLEEILALLSANSGLLVELRCIIARFNESINKSKLGSKALEVANDTLGKHIAEIAGIKAAEDQIMKQVATAKAAIAIFSIENEALISAVKDEKPIVERNMKYLVAYGTFRDKLLKYNADLPLSLAAELNERTLRFYNAINKNDHESDILVNLSLPTATGKKIEIGFSGSQKVDALQILSEGHIRCLGLAILLAKIVRDDLPFLIFDDVVNSIDDEHRGGIVDLLLGDDEIKKRQFIITTHGEEFIKRLENAVPKAEYKATVTRIDFLVPMDAKKILVKLDSPRHYLEVAERSLRDGRTRDSLSYLRKSLEEILNRLWKKIGNKSFSAQIQVGLRSPGGMPDLMALAQGLQSFLEKREVTVFQGVISELATVIGKKDTHAIVWNYLNKGTHEEDRIEEFDSTMVNDMLKLVEGIETAIEAEGKDRPAAASPAAVPSPVRL